MRFGLMLVGLALAGLGSAGCTDAPAPRPKPVASVAPRPTAPAPSTQTVKTADADKVVCRSMTPTGTIVPQKICQTRAQWKQFDDAARRGSEDLDAKRREGGTTGRGE
ncbi:MAG: hypothetical protein GC155_01525 [Alphaproteobacteria bacterium]|nr:hypothetical protein [Alphaproteobacteria bacterium]